MRKLQLSTLVIFSVLMLTSVRSWAFQSVQKSTVSAQVTTGGQRIARFNYAIRFATNPFGGNATRLGWSGVNPLLVTWKLSDNLIVMNSSVTDVGGGIQLYTDNTANDASPQFYDPTPQNTINPDSNAAGLLEGLSGKSSKTLPMAWSIKSSTRIVEGGTDATGVGAADPNTGLETAVYNNRFQWLYMMDKFNTDGIDNNGDGDVKDAVDAAPFTNALPYIVIRKANGIHFGQADSEFGALPNGRDAYVYFEANFATASSLQNYQTTTIRLEAFIQ